MATEHHHSVDFYGPTTAVQALLDTLSWQDNDVCLLPLTPPIGTHIPSAHATLSWTHDRTQETELRIALERPAPFFLMEWEVLAWLATQNPPDQRSRPVCITTPHYTHQLTTVRLLMHLQTTQRFQDTLANTPLRALGDTQRGPVRQVFQALVLHGNPAMKGYLDVQGPHARLQLDGGWTRTHAAVSGLIMSLASALDFPDLWIVERFRSSNHLQTRYRVTPANQARMARMVSDHWDLSIPLYKHLRAHGFPTAYDVFGDLL